MRELWQLYILWGVMTGLGTGALAGSLGAVVATRWFKARRGMVIGLFSSATSMGQLVFIPLLMAITVAAGWRSAVILLAVIGAAVALPIGLLMRNSPSDKGLLPFGDSGAAGTAFQKLEETRSTTVREAIRGREFWLLAFNLFICGYTTTGLITTHFISFSLEHGFDETMTAGTMGVMGAMNMVGTLTAGWLTDRYDNRKLLAVCYALRGLSLVALPFILEAPQLLFFAVIYGLDWIATAPPSINLTATIFGKGSLGTVYGWIFFSHMLGASVAAFAGGYLHGLLGSYNLVFISAAMMLFMAVPASLFIRIPNRRKETALA
ncbi:MAG: MFS transporter, partial [Dehalococcoidia bacterium]|nr:MFS transporter [Dehalococcoidia bacterium]